MTIKTEHKLVTGDWMLEPVEMAPISDKLKLSREELKAAEQKSDAGDLDTATHLLRCCVFDAAWIMLAWGNDGARAAFRQHYMATDGILTSKNDIVTKIKNAKTFLEVVEDNVKTLQELV